jgi:ABC-type branched-subunit amino acid transport system ATPase component
MVIAAALLAAALLLPTTHPLKWTVSRSARAPTALQSSVQDPLAAAASVSSGPTVLSCMGLTKAFTGTPQFEDIKLVIGKGARTGIIGINGAGKSTLLKCLAKIESADAGSIETATNANVIYVDQEPDWGDVQVYEALFAGPSKAAVATRAYFKALDPSADMDGDEFAAATDAVESAGAWDYQTNGLTIAEKLNIKNDKMYRRVNSLSGGEKKRVGLSAALLMQPDVLLLDEPTNHLDIDALEFLADYLKPGGKDKDMAMLLVTHDRWIHPATDPPSLIPVRTSLLTPHHRERTTGGHRQPSSYRPPNSHPCSHLHLSAVPVYLPPL